MEAIVYSGVGLGRKVELCLDLGVCRSSVTVAELAYILQVIKGRD